MNRIKIAAAVIAILAMISASIVALIANPAALQHPHQHQEVEDCDAEDWINREEDCGFIGPKVTPRKTAAAPKATAKPATTRR